MFGLLLLPALFVPIYSQLTLDCNFDSGFCNWQNDGNADFAWRTGESVAVDGYHSIPRTVTGTGSFSYAQGRFRPDPAGGSQRAILRSPTVTGLTNSATLEFVYWKTAIPPTLQICTQDQGATQLRCLDTISGAGAQNWQQRVVTIPANPLSFDILFVGSSFNTELDLLGIDDVVFRSPTGASLDQQGYGNRASVISNTNAVATEAVAPVDPNLGHKPNFAWEPTLFESAQKPEPLTQPNSIPVPPLPQSQSLTSQQNSIPNFNNFEATNEQSSNLAEPHPGACLAVSCRFYYDLCRWDNLYTTNFDWKYSNGRNQFRGIPQDVSGRDTYIYVSGDGRYPQQQAAIKSQQLVIPKDAFLQFYAYNSESGAGTVAIYESTSQQVQNDEAILSSATVVWQKSGFYDLGGPGWRLLRVPMPASSIPMTLLFVAYGLQNGQHYIGIDDILLVNAYGEEIGCAFDVTYQQRQSVTTEQLAPERLTAYQQVNSYQPPQVQAQESNYWQNVVTNKVSVSGSPRGIEPQAQQSANLQGPTVFRIEPIVNNNQPVASIQAHQTYGGQYAYQPNESRGKATVYWNSPTGQQQLSQQELAQLGAGSSATGTGPNDSQNRAAVNWNSPTGHQQLSQQEIVQLEAGRNGQLQSISTYIGPNDSGGSNGQTGTQTLEPTGLRRLSQAQQRPIYGATSVQQTLPIADVIGNQSPQIQPYDQSTQPIQPYVQSTQPIEPVAGPPITNSQSAPVAVNLGQLSASSGLDQSALRNLASQAGIDQSTLSNIAATGQIDQSTLAELQGNPVFDALAKMFGIPIQNDQSQQFYANSYNPDTYRHQANSDFVFQNAQQHNGYYKK